MTILWTVGHGTRPIEEFTALLRGAGIERLVDVRSFPGSRRHPQFGRERLASSLAGEGIEYAHERDLGGFRRPSADSPHTAIRNAGFRGYAEHMQTEAFAAAVERLLADARRGPTAVMCAESVPWRCHRSYLADALVARGAEVTHVLPDGREQQHVLHAEARVHGGQLVYDVRA